MKPEPNKKRPSRCLARIVRVEPCANCGVKPRWKQGRLIHNEPTCPNRWDIAEGSKNQSAHRWNNFSRMIGSVTNL